MWHSLKKGDLSLSKSDECDGDYREASPPLDPHSPVVASTVPLLP